MVSAEHKIVEFLDLGNERIKHLQGLLIRLDLDKQQANARRPHRLNGLYRRLNLYPERFSRQSQPVQAWYWHLDQMRPEFEFGPSLLFSSDSRPTTASLLTETKRFVRFSLYMLIDEVRESRGLPLMFKSELFFKQPEAAWRFDNMGWST